MKKLILPLVLMFIATAFSADDQLTIHLKNGEKRQFVLSEIMKISFSDTMTSVRESEVPDFNYSLKIEANPAVNAAKFVFNAEVRGEYTATINDISGREILIVSKGNYDSGDLRFEWEGTDRAGYSLPNGVYYCNMIFNQFSFSIFFVYFK